MSYNSSYSRHNYGGGYNDDHYGRRGRYDRGYSSDRRGGFGQDRRSDRPYSDRRGGYDDRRGGYDDRRGGGYHGGRGGYDDRRGGGYHGGMDRYDDRRGGYTPGRGDAGGARYPPPMAAEMSSPVDGERVYQILTSLISPQRDIFSAWLSAAWRSQQDYSMLLCRNPVFGGMPLDHPGIFVHGQDAAVLQNVRSFIPRPQINERRATGSMPVPPDPVQLVTSALWLDALPTAHFLVGWGGLAGWPRNADVEGMFPGPELQRGLARWTEFRKHKGSFAVSRADVVCGGASYQRCLTISLEIEVPVLIRANPSIFTRERHPYETVSRVQSRTLRPTEREQLKPATVGIDVLLRGIPMDRLDSTRAGPWAALVPWATTTGLRTLVAVLAELEAVTRAKMREGEIKYRTSDPTPGYAGAPFGADAPEGTAFGRPLRVNLFDSDRLTAVNLTWAEDAAGAGATSAPALADIAPPAAPGAFAEIGRRAAFPEHVDDIDRLSDAGRAALFLYLCREYTTSLLTFVEDVFARTAVCANRAAATAGAALVVRAMSLPPGQAPAWSVILLIRDVVTGTRPADPAAIPEAPLAPAHVTARQNMLAAFENAPSAAMPFGAPEQGYARDETQACLDRFMHAQEVPAHVPAPASAAEEPVVDLPPADGWGTVDGWGSPEQTTTGAAAQEPLSTPAAVSAAGVQPIDGAIPAPRPPTPDLDVTGWDVPAWGDAAENAAKAAGEALPEELEGKTSSEIDDDLGQTEPYTEPQESAAVTAEIEAIIESEIDQADLDARTAQAARTAARTAARAAARSAIAIIARGI